MPTQSSIPRLGARISRRMLLVGYVFLFAQSAQAAPPKPTVAVLYFDYAGADDALTPLAKGLSQMLITDLADNDALRVVERTRLESVLAEQKLAVSGKVNRRTAVRIGKLLGAKFLVLGSYFDFKQQIRIDARVVDVETGEIVKSAGARGQVDDFWSVERDLIDQLDHALLKALRRADKKRDVTRPKKRNKKRRKVTTTAVAAYGKALDKMDQGDAAGAKKLLKEVTKQAPDFELAALDLDKLLK